MVGDRSSALFFTALVHLAQDVGSTQMEAGTTASGEAVVQVARQQGMPEVVGNLRTVALFGEHACLQRLFQQVEQPVFVEGVATYLHSTDGVQIKDATKYGSSAQKALTGAAQLVQAEIEERGDALG